jgi:DNA-binding MarR family transcriptional regulator
VTIARTVEAIQFAYPQVYYACHTRHDRRRSSDAALSARDSQILVHLDRSRPIGVSRLGRHLGLAASTVSEAFSRLERFGYVTKCAGANGDRRQVGIALTAKGIAAVQSGSVLETTRLEAAVKRLSKTDRESVAHALSRLARACRPLLEEKRGWGDA